MKKNVIILGSSKSNGNTSKLCQYLSQNISADIIDLNTKNIGHYDYNNKNEGDDFLPTIKSIIDNYDTLIFATPVYWYAMSGIMKDFFDRITDLLHHHNAWARNLENKSMAILSCGSDHDLIESFADPFIASAEYLKMNYISHFHGWVENEIIPGVVINNLQRFADELK